MVNIAVVGLGYWGPNLVRNLASLDGVKLSALCDLRKERGEAICRKYGLQARIVNDYREIGNSSEVDAVVLATPIRTHYELGRFFLESGKHLFVEKPLARTVLECELLIDLAKRNGRVLMVGHVFEYNVAVRRIKEYLDKGELGQLYYVYSQRVNLGRVQNDVNALWSFAPHDVSILNYWLGTEPIRVSARGFSYLNGGIEDVMFLTVEYPNKIGAHLHMGWLDPRKVRLMTLVGSEKMLVYDDVSLNAKIQLYDKGIVRRDELVESPDSFAQFQYQVRVGDVVIPNIEFGEPLQTECRHFVDCIRSGEQPLSDGEDGLRVVKVLEAAEQSLQRGGKSIDL